ncbi:ADP-ribose pyrophosphatase YjhB (NUDIX family) [Asanoa ferruginea]|uniref:ADP-ribose pyrophosphatase YjhB (NUDIX family) n=1 Tax=Asanoa ferruginea TaxID=53367 RepID=A0A3D9ZPL3_9ACTN|nr:NUDIX domain-containing protein [Asanoa ferruginea]REF99117.1 ADP-ribose pyrophosphatase YjhB (NUDIX family) [Asanoa ferruginea]GIF51439.1 DNA mismatch repair protein MutT [Asanoa ferruginea]
MTGQLRVTCGVVVLDERDRVLLIRRDGEGTWGIPGGGLEPGETWEQAARRECLEETGWDIELDGLLGVYSDPATQTHRYPSGAVVQFVGAVFLGRPGSRTATPDGEATELGWFPLDRLPAPLFAPDVPVLRDASHRHDRPFVG